MRSIAAVAALLLVAACASTPAAPQAPVVPQGAVVSLPAAPAAAAPATAADPPPTAPTADLCATPTYGDAVEATKRCHGGMYGVYVKVKVLGAARCGQTRRFLLEAQPGEEVSGSFRGEAWESAGMEKTAVGDTIHVFVNYPTFDQKGSLCDRGVGAYTVSSAE